MRFEPTKLAGLVVIEPQPIEDERGFFARTWCRREFAVHGLKTDLAQCSVSGNHRRGTLRGMHFQVKPHEEAKLIRITRGAVYDVALDLRRDSPTFGRWHAEELSADNRRMLYIAEGLAHGFQTLIDATEVLYQISQFYEPAAARGVRWDDPAFGIEWPIGEPIMSDRDRQWPLFGR